MRTVSQKRYTLGMTRKRNPLVAVSLLLTAQACSFGVDLENLYGQVPNIEGADGGTKPDANKPPPQEDASPSDGGTDGYTDADADADAAPPPKVCTLTNALSNGDFESGAVSPWVSYNGSSTLSATAGSKRSGNFGMQIIRTGSENSMGAQIQSLGLIGTYYARLRIRSSSSIATVTFGAGDTALGLPIVPTFLCNELTDVLMVSGSSIYVAANFNTGAAERVVDMDDVVLYKIPATGVPKECTCAGAP
jgi:Carbohydrate binding domain